MRRKLRRPCPMWTPPSGPSSGGGLVLGQGGTAHAQRATVPTEAQIGKAIADLETWSGLIQAGFPAREARTLLVIRDAYGDAGLESVVIDGLSLLGHRYNGEVDDARPVARLSGAHAGAGRLPQPCTRGPPDWLTGPDLAEPRVLVLFRACCSCSRRHDVGLMEPCEAQARGTARSDRLRGQETLHGRLTEVELLGIDLALVIVVDHAAEDAVKRVRLKYGNGKHVTHIVESINANAETINADLAGGSCSVK